jgi:hypothetical protein
MSEKVTKTEQAPLIPTPEHAEVSIAEHSLEAPQPGEVIKNVEQARSKVEQNLGQNRAETLERLAAAERSADPATSGQLSRELRQASLSRELHEIRRRLPAPQRALSRIIHQPTVRLVSETAGRTVSRPSGLLGGGLIAFIGSSAYLYLAHRTGYRYNYLAFILLLAGGFVLGVLLEGLVYLATRSRRQSD